jgi:hypothetical protein
MFFYLFRFPFPVIVGLLALYGGLYLWGLIKGLKAIEGYPSVGEMGAGELGNYTAAEILGLCADTCRKMNVSQQFDIRIVLSRDFQAETTRPLFKWYFRNKHILALHEGLLHSLSKPELKAVIAHEIGHHLAPYDICGIYGEYWADYYACRYGDPVAMANALIKIDQNTYLLNVFAQRCHHLINTRLEAKYIDQDLWNYLVQNCPIPFKSKRAAKRAAKTLVDTYVKDRQIPIKKKSWPKKIWLSLKNLVRDDILNRKKLAGLMFINWTFYDNRIRNDYLDKYELIQMFNVLKNKRMTINRYHFFDTTGATHPNTNRRLLFIIENFLLPDDFSYERLVSKAAEKRFNR